MTESGIDAVMRPDRYAVVLDRCCTVENQGTVMLAEVREMKRPKDGSPLMEGLLADSNYNPAAGARPTLYTHLLQPHPELSAKQGNIVFLDLLNRVSLILPEDDDRRALRLKRVARMTPLARAQLRWKLVGHFGRAEADDTQWLQSHGYDDFGRLIPADEAPTQS
jgi:hypothetical protein